MKHRGSPILLRFSLIDGTANVHAKYRCQCISNLELSVARCMGSGGGRVRSPGVAQRPTGARCTDARNSTDCFYRAGVSRLGS